MNLKKNVDFIERFVPEEDEFILFNSESGQVKMLNRMGALIWASIGEDCTTSDEINDKISSKFPEIDRGKINNDVISFLSEMSKQGVVVYE